MPPSLQPFNWQALLADHNNGPYNMVIGVDEVGRGALAGPVYAAAVALDPQRLNPKYKMVDSKSLSPAQREALARHIQQNHKVFVASASVGEITKLNILWASLLAMRRAVEGLVKAAMASKHRQAASLKPPMPSGTCPKQVSKHRQGNKHAAIEHLAPALRPFVLVDGNYTIKNLSYPQQALIKGDQRAEPIAAASIVAKVARDTFLCQLDKKHPGYGLAQHKGYATMAHKQALRHLGATPIHRQTFAGVN